jgi:hypothetical protein
MNRRAIRLQKVKAKPGIYKRQNLCPRINPVHMGIGQFSRALQAVDGKAIDFDGEVARVPAQRLYLYAATGGVFEDADDFLPDKVGKVRGRSIEEQAGDGQNQQQQEAAA